MPKITSKIIKNKGSSQNIKANSYYDAPNYAPFLIDDEIERMSQTQTDKTALEYINHLRNGVEFLNQSISSQFKRSSQLIYTVQKHFFQTQKSSISKEKIHHQMRDEGVIWELGNLQEIDEQIEQQINKDFSPQILALYRKAKKSESQDQKKQEENRQPDQMEQQNMKKQKVKKSQETPLKRRRIASSKGKELDEIYKKPIKKMKSEKSIGDLKSHQKISDNGDEGNPQRSSSHCDYSKSEHEGSDSPNDKKSPRKNRMQITEDGFSRLMNAYRKDIKEDKKTIFTSLIPMEVENVQEVQQINN